MPRSRHGGHHELGQNFLIHRPTVNRITGLVAVTSGPIPEIGAGDSALTHGLAEFGRSLTAIDIDEHRAGRTVVRVHVTGAQPAADLGPGLRSESSNDQTCAEPSDVVHCRLPRDLSPVQWAQLWNAWESSGPARCYCDRLHQSITAAVASISTS